MKNKVEKLLKSRMADEIINISSDMIAFIDKDMTYVVVNKAYACAFGLKKKNFIGKTVQEIFGEKFYRDVIKPHADVACGGNIARYQDWFEFPATGKKFMDISYSPSYADKNTCVGFTVCGRDITELMLTEHLMHAHYENFRKIFEQAPIGIALINSKNGFFVDLNEKYCEIVGRSMAEMKAVDWMTITLEEDIEKDKAFMKRLIAGEISKFSMEKRYLRPDKKMVWVNLTVLALKEEQGEDMQHLALIEDISKSKRDDQLIGKQALSLNEAQRIARMGSWVMDVETRHIEGTENLYNILHIPGDLALHEYIEHQKIYTRTSWDLLQKKIDLAITEGTPYELEMEMINNDGTTEIMLARGEPIVNEAGIITAVQGILVNISESKKSRIAQRRATTILENTRAILFEAKTEPGWPIQYISSNINQFGYVSANFLSGRIRFSEFVSPYDRERVIAEARSYANSGADHFQQEYRIVDADDVLHWVESNTVIIRNKSGEAISYQGVILDVTEKRDILNKVDRLNRTLKTMLEINQTIVFSKSEKHLLDATCKSLVSSGSYRMAWIGFAEHDEKKSVRPVAVSGFDNGYVESLNICWADNESGRGPTGRAIRNNEVVVHQGLQDDKDYSPWKKSAEEHGYHSSVALPLVIHGDVIGAINIYSSNAEVFDEEELTLLKELAADVSYGIRSKRLEQEERNYSQAIELSMHSTIRAIALTVEKRDPYTAGHMDRVSELAVAIGKKLHLSNQQLMGINLGATIHDIGKIYIPTEILNRPGKLTDVEFEIIKTHPQVGYDIIKDIQFPWPIRDMILSHHERLDGSGYPAGLKGDEICFEAQLLAVADIVEAVSSHRPYRAAIGVDEALSIINDGKGTLFNAKVVDACTQLIQQDGFTFGSSFGLD